jgi:hypothetical protein
MLAGYQRLSLRGIRSLVRRDLAPAGLRCLLIGLSAHLFGVSSFFVSSSSRLRGTALTLGRLLAKLGGMLTTRRPTSIARRPTQEHNDDNQNYGRQHDSDNRSYGHAGTIPCGTQSPSVLVRMLTSDLLSRQRDPTVTPANRWWRSSRGGVP